MRQVLIYLDNLYEGDWDSIFYHIHTKKKVDFEKVKEYYKSINHKILVTMLDDDYPPEEKSKIQPAFVIRRKKG